MKVLLKLIIVVLVSASLIATVYFAIRRVPYFRALIQEQQNLRRLELAEEKLRVIAQIINIQPRFSNVVGSVVPIRGTYLFFDGYVTNTQDLIDLKDLVAKHSVQIDTRWSVDVTNASPTEVIK